MLTSLRGLFTTAEKATLTQQRRQRRCICHVPVLCTLAGQTEPAVVVDFAEGGLRLMIRQKARVGDVLELHYRQTAQDMSPVVPARVAWSKPNGAFCEVGVTCTQEQIFWVPVLMRSLAPTPDGSLEKRETVRVPAAMAVTLVANLGVSTNSSLDGELVDLSLGGAAFRTAIPMKLGTSVEISLGRHVTLKGHVMHTSRQGDVTHHGLRFEPMADGHRKKLVKLLQTLRQSPPTAAKAASARPKAPKAPPPPKPKAKGEARKSADGLSWLFDE